MTTTAAIVILVGMGHLAIDCLLDAATPDLETWKRTLAAIAAPGWFLAAYEFYTTVDF